MSITVRDYPGDESRDTRRDIAETSVILNIQLRDDHKLVWYKSYVNREEWYSASSEEREEAIKTAAEHLARHTR